MVQLKMDAGAGVKMRALINDYKKTLVHQLDQFDWTPVEQLCELLVECERSNNKVYICGNGGSAGNAIHLANDFIFGIDPSAKRALDVEALSANSAVLTCLGNDIGYDNIFSHQLKVKASQSDVLLVLSGSGNSPNILNALQQANELGLHTVAILGYSGGKAKSLAKLAIHFAIDDMQISEDLQLIVGHMLMRQMAKLNRDATND
jgi:D-sedoheptulose 7-phosphate isomerase